MTPYSEKRLDLFQMFYQCEPFYGGTCSVPGYEISLYYTLHDSDVQRHIDLSKAGTDELAALYAACKPAEFDSNKDATPDETYRKAKKMDLDSFSTLFDPHRLGIFEQVTRGLLTEEGDNEITEMELYKLNVYGEGDFCKTHKDTPRSENMVGSLVVVLPSQHEGGQFVFRQGKHEWELDCADKFAETTDPMVCFVAFFGDVEHEVLPITSGYRVTLTYNLYEDKHNHPNISHIATPFHSRLKGALIKLVNNKSILPEGGYLGFGLVHEYVYGKDQETYELLHHLKGADQILATICEELGLRYSLRLLYRDLRGAGINLIADRWLTSSGADSCGSYGDHFFEAVLHHRLNKCNVEGVEIIGDPFDRSVLDGYQDELSVFQRFYSNPVTKILEIRPMSSVSLESTYAQYGNSPTLDFVYGHASMLISIDPVASRKELVL